MARGRIPKPKQLNDLKVDTHKRRRHQAEPVPLKDHTTCPEHLNDVARDKWTEITTLLDQMGLLSSADSDALELYCAAYSRYRKVEEMVKNFGEAIISPVNKYPMISPYSTVMNKNLETCRRLLIEFGLTPAARSRCAITPTGKDNSGWGEFFKVAG
ncbi:phage terminase small subunit P27 family [Planctopirus limnophila]|uniref:phage terminase small subunit P27 family n=1 Tax=Planctopirus limnophila TaxID=120 RepID=UPI0001A2FF84